jgi:hypothetical protein
LIEDYFHGNKKRGLWECAHSWLMVKVPFALFIIWYKVSTLLSLFWSSSAVGKALRRVMCPKSIFLSQILLHLE